GRVAISTETTETSSDSSNGANGAVTVASNLPDGNASGSESTSSNTETRERTNFEVSETTREISREPGSIRRITVAVLVDGIRTIDENDVETWEPRSDAELAALRELVASAVGFSEERGDAITIKSLEFEPVSMVGSAEAPGFFQSSNLNIMALTQIGLLGLVAMVLGLFVLRPILSGTNTPPALENTTVLPALEGNTSPDDTPSLPSLASESANSESQFAQDLPALPSLDLARDSNLLASEDPVERLRSLLAERKQETVEILRGWMEDEEETA
ncbi:MAG: flagellar M-ring protein FliF, partial [Rhodobacterales bacterium]